MTDDRAQLNVEQTGTGAPALVLHGGGGPDTVRPIAAHLAEHMHVLLPTLPGWNGAPRPTSLDTIGDYATALLAHLADAGLRDVVVVGSSIGGWIAAEMALLDDAGRLARIVLIDAMGIEVAGEPVTDFFSLDATQVAEYSFHDSERFYVDPASLTPEQVAAQKANMATMGHVAGDMQDPGLRARLRTVAIPELTIWGDSDRIGTPTYGRAYADAFPDGRFELVHDAGHLPQLEQPAAVFALIDGFLPGPDADGGDRA